MYLDIACARRVETRFLSIVTSQPPPRGFLHLLVNIRSNTAPDEVVNIRRYLELRNGNRHESSTGCWLSGSCTSCTLDKCRPQNVLWRTAISDRTAVRIAANMSYAAADELLERQQLKRMQLPTSHYSTTSPMATSTQPKPTRSYIHDSDYC